MPDTLSDTGAPSPASRSPTSRSPTSWLPLAADFPLASESDWRALVDQVLAGADFDKKLVRHTRDGIALNPLYSADSRDSAAAALYGPQLAGGQPAWHILQRVDMPDIQAANEQALRDLENGASGLALVFADSITANGAGVAVDTDLARLFEGAYLDLIPLRVDSGAHGFAVAEKLVAFYRAHGFDFAKLDHHLGLDPLGALALNGVMEAPADKIVRRTGELLGAMAREKFAGTVLQADTRVYHGALCTEAQELGFAVATLTEYLRWGEQAGFGFADTLRLTSVVMTADGDQFMSLAKLRGFRLLWARLCELIGVSGVEPKLHVETAARMLSRRGVHVNILRSLTACFAGGLGGADSVTALAYTHPLGLPDRAARRLARTTQLVLLEESHLGRVADPAAGSGYVEALTHDLAQAGWRVFQGIESQGGMQQALTGGQPAGGQPAGGFVKKLIEETQADYLHNIATRQVALTGVSEFPDIDEAPVAVLSPALPVNFAGLAQHRLSERFEKLRDNSDDYLESCGRRPQILRINIGRTADYVARSTYAKNFFEAGGIETIACDGIENPAMAEQAVRSYQARAAVLCSSDQLYAAQAVGIAGALRAAGVEKIYLAGQPVAGRPGNRKESYRAAGVDEFIYDGVDMLDCLSQAQAFLIGGGDE